MAKYSKGASKKVETAMHEMKRGTLKSSSGQKVTNPKQAIAIGLSEARESGAKVPDTKAAGKAAVKKSAAKKAAPKKAASKKTASKKASAKTAANKSAASKRKK